MKEMFVWITIYGALASLLLYLEYHPYASIVLLFSFMISAALRCLMRARTRMVRGGNNMTYISIAIAASISAAFGAECLMASFVNGPQQISDAGIVDDFGEAFAKVFWTIVVVLAALLAGALSLVWSISKSRAGQT